MKPRHVFLLFAALTASAVAQKMERVYTLVEGDSATVFNVAWPVNCASRFTLDVRQHGNTITITQRDTIQAKAECNCGFRLWTVFRGLQRGLYTVDVYREYLVKYGYSSDTTVLIGRDSFDIFESGLPFVSVRKGQRECVPFHGDSWDVPPAVFSIYPLPLQSSSTLSFDTRWAGQVTISVYDETGRKVFTAFEGQYPGTPQSIELSTDAFPSSGVYHVLVESPSGIVARMIPVIK
ncbi:MAG: T9SS type A sorting domain-containing protein [Ignavibacteria bacterium]|nr:T9SS type A sorting domain-containing protein [Ignavibacteria bacterium]